jgi:8-oxo-dGTP diphosphatase
VTHPDHDRDHANILRAEVCVGAVAIDDDQILMVRRGRGVAQGQWSVPGGRVEFGESLAQAVVREVFEETGLEVVAERFLGWVERISDEFHYVIHDFLVTVLDDFPVPTAGDDAAEAMWIPLHELTNYNLVDGLADFLAEHGFLRLIT